VMLLQGGQCGAQRWPKPCADNILETTKRTVDHAFDRKRFLRWSNQHE